MTIAERGARDDAMSTPGGLQRFRLDGRVAVVTGAASGIGAAVATRLAADGARVLVVDLNAAAAARVAADIGGTPLAADLTDMDAAQDVLAAARTADIVVNNAGFQHVAPLEDFPPERFSAILRLMVEAPFRLVQAALPHMYAQGWGRIVNISSVHGLRASAYKSAYVTAKHGLEGLSKTIALEGGPKGVTSNTVCPAYVRTPLVEGQIAAQARLHGIPAEQVVQEIMLARSATKRLIEPAEVAELVALLVGPSSGMINGSAVTMDGGWTAS